MKPSERTIVFLSHTLTRATGEVLALTDELIAAMRVKAELTEQVKTYERENLLLRRAAKLMIAAGTGADIRGKLQAVFDAAMGEK